MKRLLYTYSSQKTMQQPASGKSSAILLETSRLSFELDVLEHIRVPRPREPVDGNEPNTFIAYGDGSAPSLLIKPAAPRIPRAQAFSP